MKFFQCMTPDKFGDDLSLRLIRFYFQYLFHAALKKMADDMFHINVTEFIAYLALGDIYKNNKAFLWFGNS